MFTGWRTVSVGGPVIDPPVLYHGNPSEKLDIVFIADGPSYVSPTNPQFIAAVEDLIWNGYFAEPLFLKNQSMFNFWIAGDSGSTQGFNAPYDPTRTEDPDPDVEEEEGTCDDDTDNGSDGVADEDDPDCTIRSCTLIAPPGWDTDMAFAEVGAIIHTGELRDCARGNQRLFSAWTARLPNVGLHETGHAPFGLADEYCCDGGYFEQLLFPNMYRTLNICEADAASVGRTFADCHQIEKDTNTREWWTSDPPSNDLMKDNLTPNALDERRINWWFETCLPGGCP